MVKMGDTTATTIFAIFSDLTPCSFSNYCRRQVDKRSTILVLELFLTLNQRLTRIRAQLLLNFPLCGPKRQRLRMREKLRQEYPMNVLSAR